MVGATVVRVATSGASVTLAGAAAASGGVCAVAVEGVPEESGEAGEACEEGGEQAARQRDVH